MARKVEMHICLGSSCFSRGNKEVVMYIRDYLKKNHLEDRFVFRGARCMGNCSKGPNLKIDESIFEGLSLSQIDAILEEVLAGTKQ